MNDMIFKELLSEFFYLTEKHRIHWIRGKENGNQYTCMMPNSFEVLIDSYAVMNHSNINVSIFINQKLVVERVIDTNQNLFDYAHKLYNKISEVNLPYEDGIVLEVLRYLSSVRIEYQRNG